MFCAKKRDDKKIAAEREEKKEKVFPLLSYSINHQKKNRGAQPPDKETKTNQSNTGAGRRREM
jgi:hypothetical protein